MHIIDIRNKPVLAQGIISSIARGPNRVNMLLHLLNNYFDENGPFTLFRTCDETDFEHCEFDSQILSEWMIELRQKHKEFDDRKHISDECSPQTLLYAKNDLYILEIQTYAYCKECDCTFFKLQESEVVEYLTTFQNLGFYDVRKLCENEKEWIFFNGEVRTLRDTKLFTDADQRSLFDLNNPDTFEPLLPEDISKKWWSIGNEDILKYEFLNVSTMTSFNNYEHVFTALKPGRTLVECERTKRVIPVIVIENAYLIIRLIKIFSKRV